MLIRPATEADLAGVAAIYDHEALTGISTFDVESVPLDYWRSRLEAAAPGDHFLVAEDQGSVVGYAYAASYRARPAYLHTRETSVYLTDGARGQGLGRAMYAELLALLRADKVHTVLAVIALPNEASEALHRSFGFEPVGVLREVGWKFDRWIDTAIWQLSLGCVR